MHNFMSNFVLFTTTLTNRNFLVPLLFLFVVDTSDSAETAMIRVKLQNNIIATRFSSSTISEITASDSFKFFLFEKFQVCLFVEDFINCVFN